jgi:hypothetical protein
MALIAARSFANDTAAPASRPADAFANKALAPDELAEYRAELKAAAERYSLASYRQEARGEAQSARREKAQAARAADNRANRESILARYNFRDKLREHPRRRAYVLSKHLARMDRIGTVNQQAKLLAQDEADQKIQSVEELHRDVSAMEAVMGPLALAGVHLAYEQDRAFAAAFQQALGEMAEAGRVLGRTPDTEFRREASNKLEDVFNDITEVLARRDGRFASMTLTHFHPGLRAGTGQQSLRGLGMYVADAWRSAKKDVQSAGPLDPESARAAEYWLAEARQIESADPGPASRPAEGARPAKRGPRRAQK